MHKTLQKRVKPANFGANLGTIVPLVNLRKTQRNEPCPCGQEEIRTYRAADGSVIREERKPLKFKNCCLNELGEQANTGKSTEERLKERRSHIGWPMRDYLNTPIRERGDFKNNDPAPMGAIPRTYKGDNNRCLGLGRPMLHVDVTKTLGFTVLIREKEHNRLVGEPKFFEVKAPDLDMEKMSSRKMRYERLSRWYNEISAAKFRAADYGSDMANDHEGKFYYVVIPKIQRSSIKVQR